VRQLAITPAGHELRVSVRADIQAGEERLLARLRPADRAAFLRAARALAELSRAELGRSLTPTRPGDRP
jgi:DNA-binding MarR family transcriptional regulator